MTACTLCNHPDRAALDAALDQGVSVSEVARRAGTSRTSVQRHAKHRGGKLGTATGDDVHPAEPESPTLAPEGFPEAGEPSDDREPLPPPAAPPRGSPAPEGPAAADATTPEAAPAVDRPESNDPWGLGPEEPAPSIVPHPEPAKPPSLSRDPEPAPIGAAAAGANPASPLPAPAEPPGEDLLAVFQELQAEARASEPERRRPGRPCACCGSPRRREIDAAIGSGMSYRAIEIRYGVSDSSARNHALGCVPEALAKAADARAAAEAQTVDTVLEEVTRLVTEAREYLSAATADDEASHKDRATWFRELRQTVELLAKLRGELVTTTNNYLTVFLNSKEWESTQKALMQAILPTPGSANEMALRGQVLHEVIAALRALDA